MLSKLNLRKEIRISVRWKLILPFLLIIVFIVVILLPITTALIAERIEREADNRLSQLAASVTRLIEQAQTEALLAANFVANLPEVETIGQDTQVAAAVLVPRRAELDVTELSYYTINYQPGQPAFYYAGPPVTRRGQASQHTRQIRDNLILGVLGSGESASGIAIAPQSSQIIGVSPVVSSEQVVGAIVAVFYIDESFVAQISQILGIDAALVKDNGIIASTIDRSSGFELMLQGGFINPSGQITSDTVTYGDGIQHRLLAYPLVLDGISQGTILVTQPINDLFQVQTEIQRVLFIFAGLVAIAMLGFGIGIVVNFARPLRKLAEATSKVSAGNFKERVKVPAIMVRDELFDLSENFNAMTERLEDLYEGLERRVQERTRELQERTQELIEERSKLDQAMHDLAIARDHALEANRAKSAFLANMSHELRTPLNAIIGYSEMLQEEAEDYEYDEFIPDLEKIRKAGTHLLSIINDILDLSKIEAGKMDLFLETFDLASLIDEVITTIQPVVEKNSNTLALDAPADLGSIHCDMTKLRQITFNLLSNAAKFTSNGTITLAVKREARNDGDWIRLNVSDTGIGMTPEQISNIFKEFTQADASTTRKYGGTGLGLTISRHFSQMMGGDITVSSEVGRGTTFSVQFPAVVVRKSDTQEQQVVKPAERKEKIVEQPSESAEERQGDEVVLIIDDDPVVRDMLSRSIGREGYRVVSAADGEEGLRMAKQFLPKVITLDVMMPGMDGWAVLTALKADPEVADIPVIVLTMLDNKNLGFALGASDYLTKPIDRTRLVAMLNKYRYKARTLNGASGHILVIEDDAETRELVRRTLEKEQWVVAEAENGQIGLVKVAQKQPDLILLDLMMPEMDGFQFITELRNNPTWHDIPVIVITAKELTSEDRKQLNGHVERILQKAAYSSHDLLREVTNLVQIYIRR